MRAVERLFSALKRQPNPEGPHGGMPPMEHLLEEAENAVKALRAQPFLPSHKLTAGERGHHGRRRSGPGDNFWQYRQFGEGDAPADIDWRRSARGDSLYIRQQEWETAETLWVMADFSGSMRFSSHPSLPQKAERAAVISLALANITAQAGERVGWSGAKRAVSGQAGYGQLTKHMDLALANDEFHIRAPSVGRMSGYILVVSDFLLDEAKTYAFFKSIRDRGLVPVCVFIRDPLEENWSGSGRVNLKGCEGEEPLLLSRADDISTAYASRQKAHFGALHEQVRAARGHLFVHRTDETVSDLLAKIAPNILSMGDW